VHTPKKDSGFVSRFADLTGITNIQPKRGFEIVPYGVARTDLHSRADNPFIEPSSHRMDAGVDLKYGLTSSLTLTGTINPDFGQVKSNRLSSTSASSRRSIPRSAPSSPEADVFKFGTACQTAAGASTCPSRRSLFAPHRPLAARLRQRGGSASGETTILARQDHRQGGRSGPWACSTLTDQEEAWFRNGEEIGSRASAPRPTTSWPAPRASTARTRGPTSCSP
jgi:hypothetical protein